MEIYETEEEQVAALKDWWKANGTSMMTGIVGAIVIVLAWNFWQDHQADKINQASAMYEQLVQADAANQAASVEKIGTRLNTEFAGTAYASYALLFQAKTKVEQQDLPAAKTLLQQVISTTADAELKHVARTRLIRVLLGLQEFEPGLQVIAGVDQASLGGFEATYKELEGDLYVAMGRVGEARTAYQASLKAGQGSPLLQFKLDDLAVAE
ncbi:MAG: tetratricopeptide repeat protein [Methyloprofundus sp.]|nr:tetratricopeptide repeat protein [Methyloprofundus sp.]